MMEAHGSLHLADFGQRESRRLDQAYFSLEVQRVGTTLGLRLAGEFDWAVIGHLEGALEQALEVATEQIVFDLSALEFLDAAGLAAILQASERAHEQRVNVTVVRPRGRANAIFALTGADERLAMMDQS
jgi:anti-anti-sigma factor